MSAWPLLAHEVPTHLNITRAAVQYLNQAIDKSGASAGQGDAFRACSRRIEELLLIGTAGEDEDEGNRFMFHFTPALNDEVKGDVRVLGIKSYGTCSSIQWAFWAPPNEPCTHNFPLQATVAASGAAVVGSIVDSPVFTTTLTNEHTWQNAVQAGRGFSQKDREGGWTHLGYLLHLLQDLTSPAHVRNDAHPHKNAFVIDIGDADPVEAIRERTLRPLTNVGILKTFDTAQELFWDLQKDTQRRFYSKDRTFITRDKVGNTLDGPAATSELGDYFFQDDRIIAVKGTDYRRAQLLGLRDPKRFATVDASLADEQWAELGPQAVMYTASLIYQFYREIGWTVPCVEGRACTLLSGEVSQVYPAAQALGLGALAPGDSFAAKIQMNTDPTAVDQSGSSTIQTIIYRDAEFQLTLGGLLKEGQYRPTSATRYPDKVLGIAIANVASGYEFGFSEWVLIHEPALVPLGQESTIDALRINGIKMHFDLEAPNALFSILLDNPTFPSIFKSRRHELLVTSDASGDSAFSALVNSVSTCTPK